MRANIPHYGQSIVTSHSSKEVDIWPQNHNKEHWKYFAFMWLHNIVKVLKILIIISNIANAYWKYHTNERIAYHKLEEQWHALQA